MSRGPQPGRAAPRRRGAGRGDDPRRLAPADPRVPRPAAGGDDAHRARPLLALLRHRRPHAAHRRPRARARRAPAHPPRGDAGRGRVLPARCTAAGRWSTCAGWAGWDPTSGSPTASTSPRRRSRLFGETGTGRRPLPVVELPPGLGHRARARAARRRRAGGPRAWTARPATTARTCWPRRGRPCSPIASGADPVALDHRRGGRCGWPPAAAPAAWAATTSAASSPARPPTSSWSRRAGSPTRAPSSDLLAALVFTPFPEPVDTVMVNGRDRGRGRRAGRGGRAGAGRARGRDRGGACSTARRAPGDYRAATDRDAACGSR